MMWRDVVGLIQEVLVPSPYGGSTKTDGQPREVFANAKSVKGVEFYQALAVGVKAEKIFEIRAAEYQDEPKLLHEGTTYHVVRTYSRDGELIDLTCSRYPMGG
ncbi:phage head closure protein [Paenibacillus sp. N4]|uniref:phage head closure protein n=1 Tax=Paenibacillus vietnamensis TaxID=2590547 RepID=UPI001CD11314|nr:phage head closure protein [Paenibacillus vietnamensis]MCA0754909.1 phage head closure protein [Paenibacillus vietnamensis]